jgi:lipoprotein-releasing system ATP-binding protein
MRVRAEGLTKTYPTPAEPLVVLDRVDLDLVPGDAVAVTGPSGSGKSTLLHILGTLDERSGGRLELDGVDPATLSPRELAGFRNRSLGFIFQEHYLLPQLSVLENVLLPALAARGGAAPHEPWARELLGRVGLSQRLLHRPAELSGGERQRTAIARALVLKPGLLLCDEPTGNLDAAASRRAGDLLFDLHRDLGCTLVVVTHSRELAERFERRCELRDGRLAVEAQPTVEG